MAGIQMGIQLRDDFSNAMMGIINSVNLAVSSMDDMSQAMNVDIDTSSIDGAREHLNQATIAVMELNQAMESMSNVSVPDTDIPYQWQSDTMPVFNSSGVERFQQEVQRTDALLNNLNNSQRQIERTAATMDILPQSAIQDITSMSSRIQNIRDKIRQIEANPLNMGTGSVNNELEQLRSKLTQILSEQENLSQAMGNMNVSEANASYLRLSQVIGDTERYIRDNSDEQSKFNYEIRAGTNYADSLGGRIKAIAATYLSIRGISGLLGRVGITDTSGAFDRIDIMNQFQKTVSIMTGDAELANAALAQLKDNTVGTAYGLDVASKATQGFLTRGMSLGAATNQVRIWADAVSFYGKGTNEQLESVIDALGKMYSKGKVEADQLDRLFDAGIGAAEIYAKAVGKSVAVVKEDLSEGAISSAQFIETVSQAMDKGVSSGAAKEAGSTWATTFANMNAAVTRGWTDIINKLDASLASHGLPSTMEMVTMFGQKAEGVLKTVGDNMDRVVSAAVIVGDTFGTAGSFISDNWGTIAPIIGAVVAAYIAYNGVLLAYNAVRTISNTIEAISMARAALHAGLTLGQAAALRTATGAQLGFNAALLACPLTWIIFLIIALIAVIVAVANHIAKTGVIATTTFGAITGGGNVVLQFFKNLGLEVANTAIGITNAIQTMGYNVGVSFQNAYLQGKMHAYNLLSTVEEVIALICRALDKLPFIEFDFSGMADAAERYAARYADKATAASGSRKEYRSVADAFRDGRSTFDTFKKDWAYDAYTAGAEWGDGVSKKIKGLFSSKATKASKDYDYSNKLLGDTSLTNTAANTADTAKNTSKIADSVAMTGEDLKYMRDLAEHDYINRFTTAKITVNQTNHNNVNNNMDLDGINDYLRSDLEQRMAAAAEGVH